MRIPRTKNDKPNKLSPQCPSMQMSKDTKWLSIFATSMIIKHVISTIYHRKPLFRFVIKPDLKNTQQTQGPAEIKLPKQESLSGVLPGRSVLDSSLLGCVDDKEFYGRVQSS